MDLQRILIAGGLCCALAPARAQALRSPLLSLNPARAAVAQSSLGGLTPGPWLQQPSLFASDGETELRVLVLDRVPAGEHGTGLVNLVERALDHAVQLLGRQVLGGEADQIDAGHWLIQEAFEEVSSRIIEHLREN